MNHLAPTPETALMLFRTQRFDTRQIAIKLGLFTKRPSSRRIKGPGPYPDEAAALKLIQKGREKERMNAQLARECGL